MINSSSNEAQKSCALKEKQKTVVDALRMIALSAPEEKITIDSFSKGLGRRGYGLLLLVLNIPNLIPLPLPLLSMVFGIPLAIVALQLALGFERPWLPNFARRQGIRKKEILYFCDQIDTRYGWLHRLLHPRLPLLTYGKTVRLIGLAICVLAATMVLPIPLGNLVLAIPIFILSLGLIERDGLFIIVGFLLGTAGIAFNFLIGSSILLGFFLTVEHFFDI